MQVGCHPLHKQQAEVKRLSCLIYAECTLRQCHSWGRATKSVYGEEHRSSNTVSDRKGRLNSSKAITKIKGILKLNGDCPCQNEKAENAHILAAGPARKSSDFPVAGFFIF